MILNESGYFSDELMAFVLTCLFCETISRDEFNAWCAQASSLNAAPAFLYDLMDFVPCWEHEKNDEYALYGIAVRRGFEPFDMPVTPSEALDSLKASPNIELLFGQVFDFIKL